MAQRDGCEGEIFDPAEQPVIPREYFYDKPIDGDLVARRMVYCPRLLKAFVTVARDYWEDLQTKGVPAGFRGLESDE